ncbi:MAG: SpoVA/SpoVAEb family sporulation membrane protein [Firmicutes bacterium]|nr:SpoVA/SpoVAEb family sporulation membrane protein [Clostridiales bacterium]MBQ9931530.1 SpoVA/SpoVAEb family sporulation membrane protein [Bacillota bacterium]
MSEKKRKQEEKEFREYIKRFTPKPRTASNCVKAFLSGGLICAAALWIKNRLLRMGIDEDAAGGMVTVILICTAQLLTGIGIFDKITKFTGAGTIVPITGFANAMVAPAIEYKQEGKVLGAGAKLFSVAGPVLVCGISLSVLIGMIYCFAWWITGR